MPRFVFARASVSLRERGSKYPTQVQQGQAWYADHPIVKDHPDAFSAEPPIVHPRGWEQPVEQATAAPGEKRTARRAD